MVCLYWIFTLYIILAIIICIYFIYLSFHLWGGVGGGGGGGRAGVCVCVCVFRGGG